MNDKSPYQLSDERQYSSPYHHLYPRCSSCSYLMDDQMKFLQLPDGGRDEVPSATWWMTGWSSCSYLMDDKMKFLQLPDGWPDVVPAATLWMTRWISSSYLMDDQMKFLQLPDGWTDEVPPATWWMTGWSSSSYMMYDQMKLLQLHDGWPDEVPWQVLERPRCLRGHRRARISHTSAPATDNSMNMRLDTSGQEPYTLGGGIAHRSRTKQHS